MSMLIYPFPCSAKRVHPERWYQELWCAQHRGTQEVILGDGSRADCITADHAVEFDFADKWAEAVGQSLLYGAHTGKRSGIVIIMEDGGDERFVERLDCVIIKYGLPIDVWTVKP
jgi:hypothetical protein